MPPDYRPPVSAIADRDPEVARIVLSEQRYHARYAACPVVVASGPVVDSVPS
jgi:hypothetical protein